VEAVLTQAGVSELAWKLEEKEFRCRVDSTTHYDTLTRPMRAGDRVSVWLWEQTPGDCRVLSARILASAPIGERPRIRLNLNPLDSIFQRGNMQYSGVVLMVAGNRMTVQTRTAGRLTFLLRPDTHFLFGGAHVPLSEVPINQRVYVRAGTTFEGHLEAFRVAWGYILRPTETEFGLTPSTWGKP
jgi:hypothetical protein